MAKFNKCGKVGGGSFRTTFYSNLEIIPSSTGVGVAITLTPPSGEKVRLTSFRSAASQGAVIKIDGVAVTSGLLEDDSGAFAGGQFFLQEGSPSADGAGRGESINGDVNEVITIELTSISTSIINFMYQYGK